MSAALLLLLGFKKAKHNTVEDKNEVLVYKLDDSKQGHSGFHRLDWVGPFLRVLSMSCLHRLPEGDAAVCAVSLGLRLCIPRCSALKQATTGLWMELCSLGSTRVQI